MHSCFTDVCDIMICIMGYRPSPPPDQLGYTTPLLVTADLLQTCSLDTTPTPTTPRNTATDIHRNFIHIVGKRAVRILLECFLVHFIITVRIR